MGAFSKLLFIFHLFRSFSYWTIVFLKCVFFMFPHIYLKYNILVNTKKISGISKRFFLKRQLPMGFFLSGNFSTVQFPTRQLSKYALAAALGP